MNTKGKSVIKAVNYKGDVLTQVWMDSRMLATLCNWMESKGMIPRFMSEVVRVPLEMLVEVLLDTGEAQMIDDTILARKMLEDRFRVNLNRGNKGHKNLLHNVILSGERQGLAERIAESRRINDIEVPQVGEIRTVPEGFDIDRALEIFHKGNNDE